MVIFFLQVFQKILKKEKNTEPNIENVMIFDLKKKTTWANLAHYFRF